MTSTLWRTPVSLLAHWTLTSAVSGRRAASTASGGTSPRLSGWTRVTSFAHSRAASSTELCSTAETTACLPSARRRAVLLLSVPPEVKTISAGSHRSSFASVRRVCSSIRRAWLAP